MHRRDELRKTHLILEYLCKIIIIHRKNIPVAPFFSQSEGEMALIKFGLIKSNGGSFTLFSVDIGMIFPFIISGGSNL